MIDLEHSAKVKAGQARAKALHEQVSELNALIYTFDLRENLHAAYVTSHKRRFFRLWRSSYRKQYKSEYFSDFEGLKTRTMELINELHAIDADRR